MSNETEIRNDSVEQYAIEIRNDSDQQAVRIKSDGSIIFGEGFTVDSAAREFWLQIGKLFPTMFVPVDNLSALVAELSRREADLHKMYNERMDTLNERFDQQRMREQAEAKAGCAALLEKAAKKWRDLIKQHDCEGLGTGCGLCAAWHLCANDLETAIPTDAAAALADLLRDARYKSTSHSHGCYFCGKQGIGKDRHLVLLCDEHVNIHAALAEEKRKARLEVENMWWQAWDDKTLDEFSDWIDGRRAELRAEKGAADGTKKL